MTALMALVAVLAGTVLAEARVYSGTGKANRVAGTKKADTLRLRGGHDRARGRAGADRIFGAAGNDRLRGDGGADRLVGGRGSDRLHGGKGRDRLSGGGGNDTLNSVDRRKDAAVAGGRGRNRCRIDSVDLPVVRGCGSIVVAPGGSVPGGGSSGGLALTSATGLQCASELPTCSFSLSGTGADTLVGTVTGGGGVTSLGGSVAAVDENWSALGTYGCTADGYLRVAIGSEQLDVPVDCR